MWIKKFQQILSLDSSGRTSNMQQITRMGKRPSGQSGSAMLWSMVVLAVLVIVTLALVMGRGKEHAPVPELDMHSPAQVQKPARQDMRPREEKRFRPPADPQRMPDRALRPPPPGARRPGGPPVPPPDPRQRKRSLESRYDFSRSPDDDRDGPGDWDDDVSGFDDGGYEQQDDYDPEADVSGSFDPATPA
ncbi:MAG: hypothetical protein FJ119_08995 [Deltaproteobacteria bacterium]|nr:hypothetical protein [Deltaproteobacteria bacterium]